MVCCKSSRHWLTAAPYSNSTETTDGRGVGHGHRDILQLLCFRCMQAITADTVFAYITHDYRPNISSSSSRHGAKRRGGLWRSAVGGRLGGITLMPHLYCTFNSSFCCRPSSLTEMSARSLQRCCRCWQQKGKKTLLTFCIAPRVTKGHGETARLSKNMTPSRTATRTCLSASDVNVSRRRRRTRESLMAKCTVHT